MNKNILALLLMASLAPLGAQAGVASFQSVSGKVEYQAPGGSWKVASVGDSIQKGGLVSVGFKSSAVVRTADASITVKPLTRLSIEEIVSTSGGTRTSIRLSAGSIRTEVTPVSGTKSFFSVRSPTATASVRGTGFEFDGLNLLVDHGAVNLSGTWGRNRVVEAGYASYALTAGDVAIPFLTPSGGVTGVGARSGAETGGEGLISPTAPRLPQGDFGTVVITVPTD